MARVVITHSTYIDGLIKNMNLLAKDNSIKTITPWKIMKTKGRCEGLTIIVTTKVRGGHKLIVRKGYSVQEVFLLTSLTSRELANKIDNLK